MQRRTTNTLILLAALAAAASPAAAESSYSFSSDTFSRFVGRTHAILVHFPIALILVASFIELSSAFITRFRKQPEGYVPSVASAGLTALCFGALGGVAAATAGWLNADHEGVGSSVAATLAWHRWLGVSAAALAILLALMGLISRTNSGKKVIPVYRGGLLLAAAVVGITGHLGGNMVYGDGYLLAAFEVEHTRPAPSPAPVTPPTTVAKSPSPDSNPAPAPAPIPSPTPTPAPTPSASDTSPQDPATLLASRVSDIFNRTCIECHGVRKQKGKLRLDTLDRAIASESINKGKPEESELYKRLLLPEGDDDHMPKDDPSLPQDDIKAIHDWILVLGGITPASQPSTQQAQASEPSSPTAPTQPPSAIEAARQSATIATTPPAAAPSPPAPAAPPLILTDAQKLDRQRAIDAIHAAGAYAAPISSDSEFIHVNFAMMGKSVSDQSLALLSGLEPVLYELNLSNTSVTDAGLKDLTRFPRLERLNLSRTQITDQGLREIAALPHLASINLHNTPVTDAAVDVMSGMTSLRKAFVWRTAMTTGGLSRLTQARADLTIESGAPLPVPAPPPEQPTAAAAAPTTVPPPAAPPSATAPPAPPTQVAAKRPPCCLKAEADGHECDHPCCVEARKAGKVCAKCLGN